jgi:hypothetical protein
MKVGYRKAESQILYSEQTCSINDEMADTRKQLSFEEEAEDYLRPKILKSKSQIYAAVA